MRRCDVLIVGGGLAGCVLARELARCGKQSVVVDRAEPVTSSKIAAGLLTPVTGQRLTVAWGWNEFRPAAEEFYRRVETETGRSLFAPLNMARLFVSERERNWFESKRRDNPAYAEVLGKPSDWDDLYRDRLSGPFPAAPLGGFVLRGGARLDVPAFVAATREAWLAQGDWLEGEVTDADMWFEAGHIVVEKWDLSADRVVLCRGAVDGIGPGGGLFPRHDLRPSKGEILDVRIEGWSDRRVIHRGMWLAPAPPAAPGPEGAAGGLARAGATYDWNQLDGTPTDAGRQDILRQLQDLVSAPIAVVGHQAAVRPTPRAYRPLIGIHPTKPRLAVFNGLGSRGALQAPLMARHLHDAIFRGREISVDCRPRFWHD